VTVEVILERLEIVVGQSKLRLITSLWIEVREVLEVYDSVTGESSKRSLSAESIDRSRGSLQVIVLEFQILRIKPYKYVGGVG